MRFSKNISANILFTIGTLLIGACNSTDNKSTTATGTETAVLVTTGTPGGNQAGGISASGQIEAVQTVNISTRVMGYITSLHVKEGDKVSKGQVIATINDQDIAAKRAQVNAMISEAEANLKNTEKDYERFTTLQKQQSASAKEVDNVTLQYQSAKAKVEAAKQMRNEVNAQMNYTTLVSPISGTVIKKMAEAGTMASPGMPIVVIEQSGNYQISASIPETEISKIKTGSLVSVSIKSINQQFDGSVTEINPSSQFSGGQYIVKIAVPTNQKNGLYSGMYANVFIPVKTDTTANANTEKVLIPLSSIVYKDQLTGIYTISNNNTASLRWIRLGKKYGNDMEVISGLNKDEAFIVSAEGKLYNGTPVKLK